MAEREGFEPSVPLTWHAGFQDRYLQPLGHLSMIEIITDVVFADRLITPKGTYPLGVIS